MFAEVLGSANDKNFAINIVGTLTVRSPVEVYNDELGFELRHGIGGAEG